MRTVLTCSLMLNVFCVFMLWVMTTQRKEDAQQINRYFDGISQYEFASKTCVDHGVDEITWAGGYAACQRAVEGKSW